MTKPLGRSSAATNYPEYPYRVAARVVVAIPEFGLVYVETAEGLRHVLTARTHGRMLDSLKEGQRVDCLISTGPPRVLSAIPAS